MHRGAGEVRARAQAAARTRPLKLARVGALQLGLGGRGERAEAARHAGGQLGEECLRRVGRTCGVVWGRVGSYGVVWGMMM